MVLRREALAERLAALRAAVARLRSAALRPLDDDWDEWALERGMQIAAQALFDTGNHVLAGAFAARPREYADVPPDLARRGVISIELAARLKGLAGFRNLLVHDYVRVDPKEVRRMLATRLDDLAAFADAVDAWVALQPSD